MSVEEIVDRVDGHEFYQYLLNSGLLETVQVVVEWWLPAELAERVHLLEARGYNSMCVAVNSLWLPVGF